VGTSVNASTSAGAAAAAKPARIETKFFEQGEVLVTNARLVKGGQTFAMAGVTSVRTAVEAPSKKGPAILIVIGIIFFLAGLASSVGVVIFGLILVAAGIWWLTTIKNIYHVILVSASGENKAISDNNQEYVGGIVTAINEALIHRG